MNPDMAVVTIFRPIVIGLRFRPKRSTKFFENINLYPFLFYYHLTDLAHLNVKETNIWPIIMPSRTHERYEYRTCRVQRIRIFREVIWLGTPGDISRWNTCRSSRVFLCRRSREPTADSPSTDARDVQRTAENCRSHFLRGFN